MPKSRLVTLAAVLSFLLMPCVALANEGVSVAALRNEIEALRQQLAQKEALLRSYAQTADTPAAQAIALAAEPRQQPASPRIAPSSTLGWDKAVRAANAVRYMIPGSSLMTVMATGSMKPMFDERAVLIMENAAFEDLKVGDIVTYLHPKHKVPVVHRIIEQREGAFWCKGDNNGQADEVAITRENFQARVFGIVYARESGVK